MQILLMGHTSSFMHLKKKLRYENDSSSFLFRLEIQISYTRGIRSFKVIIITYKADNYACT